MRTLALLWLTATVLLHALPQLPDVHWAFALGPVLALAAWPRVPLWLRLPMTLLAALLWGLWRLPGAAQEQLPDAYAGAELELIGHIDALPVTRGQRTDLVVAVEQLRAGDTAIPFHGRVQLAWYEATASPQVGERWRFGVRLRRPHGFANPGSYDRERRLYAAGIHARGSVRTQPAPQRLAAASGHWIDRLRERLAANYARLLPDDPGAAILAALTIGDESGLSAAQWELFRRTGTGHLIAISGQQIALIAAAVFFAVRGGVARLGWLAARLPPVRVAAVAALLAATAYALIAGDALPVRRALLMVWVAMLALLLGRAVWSTHTLAVALWLVLLLDPAAPLGVGFWLSFGAVALILYLVRGRADGFGVLRQGLQLQWAISLGVLPATVVLFGQLPLVSPVSNLLAIPWSSLTMVPLALPGILLSLVSDTLAAPLLQLASLATAAMLDALAALAAPAWASYQLPIPPLWTLLLLIPGTLWCLAPAGFPARGVGLLLCLPLLFHDFPRPPPGGWRLTQLDVGYGLAVVVETATHTLVYDTGPRLGRVDAAQLVVLPYLQTRGIRRIDTLILSHADSTHTGGAGSLRAALPVGRSLTTDLLAIPLEGATACRSGQSWVWDGVHFEVLSPSTAMGAGDEASCVLHIAGPGGSALLAGDLSVSGQERLMRQLPALHADVLLAPGQGAKAPADGFVAALAPRWVLFSTGYGNRWGYPRPPVVAAWRAGGASIVDTATDGALIVDAAAMSNADGPSLQRWRERAHRHWWAH